MINPTDEQLAIRESARTSNASLMISAYAGCAKTTSLEMAASQIKVPGLALAFNVSIKKELAKRFPGNFSVQTMNGLGFGALMRSMPHVNKWAEPDGRKIGKLVSQVAKEWKIELAEGQWDSAKALVGQAMLFGLVPRDEPLGLISDTLESWRERADELLIGQEDFLFLYELAREVLLRSNALTRQGIISFDDQVYYPTVVSGKWPQFPVLLVDEAQDLSPLNHAMLTKAMRPDGRLLACGDSRQAIYAFRGADSASMARIEGLRRDWQHLPLTLTFRCSKLVVSRQQSHAPGFRAFETNHAGRYERLGRVTGEEDEDTGIAERQWSWIDVRRALPKPDASLAILCRNNGPLLGMAFKLIRQRIAPVMLGRDIGQGLVVLSRKLFPENSMLPSEMLAKLAEWELSETSLLIANGHDEKVSQVTDRTECLRAILTFAEVRDAGSLREALRSLFSRDTGDVMLGSIHRSKGLEWDVVMHLDPWRIPSKWAREAAKRGDERQLGQEFNLKYVCETRTRNVLLEANFKEFI